MSRLVISEGHTGIEPESLRQFVAVGDIVHRIADENVELISYEEILGKLRDMLQMHRTIAFRKSALPKGTSYNKSLMQFHQQLNIFHFSRC